MFVRIAITGCRRQSRIQKRSGMTATRVVVTSAKSAGALQYLKRRWMTIGAIRNTVITSIQAVRMHGIALAGAICTMRTVNVAY